MIPLNFSAGHKMTLFFYQSGNSYAANLKSALADKINIEKISIKAVMIEASIIVFGLTLAPGGKKELLPALVQVRGQGVDTCETWKAKAALLRGDTSQRNEARAYRERMSDWIDGYMSGASVNTGNDIIPQLGNSDSDILAEIDKECASPAVFDVQIAAQRVIYRLSRKPEVPTP